MLLKTPTKLPGVNIVLHQWGRRCRRHWPLCTEGMSETAATKLITFPRHDDDAQHRFQLWLQQHECSISSQCNNSTAAPTSKTINIISSQNWTHMSLTLINRPVLMLHLEAGQ